MEILKTPTDPDQYELHLYLYDTAQNLHRNKLTSFILKRIPAIILFFIIMAPLQGWAQGTVSPSGGIRGRIHDNILNKDIPFVVVAIVDADSCLVAFTRTTKDGSWAFNKIPVGLYHVLISHPSYENYRTGLTIRKDAVSDLGNIVLGPKYDSLSVVVVTPKSPLMHIKGDTLEYNTANMKLKVNASVEELLTRLPGVQIDANGGITVNGKRVQRLMVDGEDVFGGDPTIVTRNFNADMIAKVQVLDKKSSQADFTGVDDGQRTKTINLTLKEDSKKGYFSKTEAGGDPKGIYNVNALLGAFKDKLQFAALGMIANNGARGFNGAIGNMNTNFELEADANDALSASAGGGIPQVVGGAIHYANKWNGNDDHIVGNYQYGRLVTHPSTTSLTEQVLPDSIFVQSKISNSVNSANQHALNADYDWIVDSLSAFRFSIGGLTRQGQNQFNTSDSSSFNDTLVNNSIQSISSRVQTQNFRGSIMWKKQGRKKKGRSISLIAGGARQDNSTNGYLYAVNNFYQPSGRLLSTDTIDQKKMISSTGLIINGDLSFTEPLWRGAILGSRYEMSFNRSQSRLGTYNKGDGKYLDFVDSLSNHYQYDLLTERGIINLQATARRLSYTIGGDILHYANRQRDLMRDSVLHYTYFTFAPRMNLQYNQTSNMSFSFGYSGSTSQPSIMQLQPVQNNTDPLHIAVGNPDLHTSFSHHFELSLNSTKPNLSIGTNYDFTSNAISTRTITDSLGRQISQPVNVNGSRDMGINISGGTRLRTLEMNVDYSAGLSYGRSVNFLNSLLAHNDNYNVGTSVSISKNVVNKYSFRIASSASYSYSNSSADPGVVTRFWAQNHNADISIFPLPGMELYSSCHYTWRQKTSVFDKNNSTIFLNAGLSKVVWRNQLSLRWEIKDIFGQNAGISRIISGNVISQSSFNTIGRYWMITATYRFINHGRIK